MGWRENWFFNGDSGVFFGGGATKFQKNFSKVFGGPTRQSNPPLSLRPTCLRVAREQALHAGPAALWSGPLRTPRELTPSVPAFWSAALPNRAGRQAFDGFSRREHAIGGDQAIDGARTAEFAGGVDGDRGAAALKRSGRAMPFPK